MSQEDDGQNYSTKLVHRIFDQVTFDENEQSHQSEDFDLKQRRQLDSEQGQNIEFEENEEENFELGNIKWPTIGQFNETVGAEKIDEYIKNTWEFDQCWLYCIDLIDKTEKEFSYLYTYRVCWSIPTRRKPIPRFTANVYFTYEVSKIKPKEKLVDVRYVLETQKLVHKPGESRFRQQWLSDILDLKERLISDCKF